MSSGKAINVECQCGYLLFKYYKGGHGRLIKCFLNKLIEDNVGISKRELGERPLCPKCGKSLGTIRLVNGRPALKLNQGTIKKIRT